LVSGSIIGPETLAFLTGSFHGTYSTYRSAIFQLYYCPNLGRPPGPRQLSEPGRLLRVCTQGGTGSIALMLLYVSFEGQTCSFRPRPRGGDSFAQPSIDVWRRRTTSEGRDRLGIQPRRCGEFRRQASAHIATGWQMNSSLLCFDIRRTSVREEPPVSRYR
jgi:hypothetical protein